MLEMKISTLVTTVLVLLSCSATDSVAAAPPDFNSLRREYSSSVLKLVGRRCATCHSTKDKKGELDLQRFDSLASVRRDPKVWIKVIEQLDNGEMPPKDAPQLTKVEKKLLRGWARRYLDAEALARAGDPGRVVLRRLSNVEYTRTVRELTGLPTLDPAREFPVDGAAGEGFTNTGESLVMSPALLNKYLDAAKGIAAHAVLLPDGFRFDRGTTRRDWSDSLMARIKARYARHVGPDGRVDVARYFEATLANRKVFTADPKAVRRVAEAKKLSAPYLEKIWKAMNAPGDSPMLKGLAAEWRAAKPGDGKRLAAAIKRWESQLWMFGTVGHFKPWQSRKRSHVEHQALRLKLVDADKDGKIVVSLAAGTAGDGTDGDLVHWQQPRLVATSKPAIFLRDVRGVAAGLDRLHRQELPAVGRYLAAVDEVDRAEARVDVKAVAARHKLDRHLLSAWLQMVGVGDGQRVQIAKYLPGGFVNRAGHDFIDGYGVAETPSLLTNSSDRQVNVPGTMAPHSVVMHPSPTLFVAAGWRSPVTGRVKIEGFVQDVHPNCGNGVTWRLDLARGRSNRVLRSGAVDRAGRQTIPVLKSSLVRAGDLLSLKVGPKGRDHTCDLTRFNLVITELTGKKRTWNIEKDIADTINDGNPHADQHGNADTWHFYQEPVTGPSKSGVVPEGSLLAQWLEVTKPTDRRALADRIAELVAGPRPKQKDAPDTRLFDALTRSDGTLLGLVDPLAMGHEAAGGSPSNDVGPDPKMFGRSPDGVEVGPADLVVTAPSVLTMTLPASVAAGRELIVTGRLHKAAKGRGSVQLSLGSTPPAVDRVVVGPPIVVGADSPGARRVARSVSEFQDLFPAAMCYYRLVPVDEVITLVLFHREDEPLMRLMMTKDERQGLERDWKQLRFVSQDARKIHSTFDLFQGFASQVGKVKQFEPLREPIRKRALEFEKHLKATEPVQVEKLLDFAGTAWRRPLVAAERETLRTLYGQLRSQGLSHDAAWRLLLARVLVSANFLYRVEKPVDGRVAQPVNDWELASRLSYFLWSSPPDGALRQAARSGQLQDPKVVAAQAVRMLDDRRIRGLATEFAAQWIGIRGFDSHDEKNEKLYPQFAKLRGAMYEESVRFFEHVFRSDGRVLDLVDADYTFVNAELAKFYGLVGQGKPVGSQKPGVWWRVDGLKARGRGGVLGMASLLAKQSGASRTSPVLRGNWVVETMLGEKLPKPPAKVPDLPDSETDTNGLTVRQLVEKHRQVASCAVCHDRIDPFGFALESFDAIGRLRQKDLAGRPIDTRVALKDGTRFNGIGGLRNYLLTKRRDQFVKQFCRKLLGFALGRSVELSDEPLLQQIQKDLKANDYRLSVVVRAIVTSRQFRYHRGLLATKSDD